MSLKEELLAVTQEGKIGSKPRPKHPTGWEPRIDTETGTAVMQSMYPPDEARIDWSEWLVEWGFSPEDFDIEDDRVEVRTWDMNIGAGEVVRLWYYKAKIVRKRAKADLTALISEIKKHKPLKKSPPPGDLSYIIVNSDWQLGKRDGDGTKGVVDRVLNGIDSVQEDYRKARKEGYELDQLVVANVGDIIEGCKGHYPMQTFNVELDRREQVKVGRRLLTKQLEFWSKDFEKVLVVAVPGNHGENREDGKAFTQFGDNDDVAFAEQVEEALSQNPERYGHVKFHITNQDLTCTLDISGTIVTFSHSHQSRGSAKWGHVKTLDWWKEQALGRRPVSDADLLVTGHYHYLAVTELGERLHVQVPALDGGSQWYEEARGIPTSQGIVTLVVGNGKVLRMQVIPSFTEAKK